MSPSEPTPGNNDDQERRRGALLVAVSCVLAVVGASAGGYAYFEERTSQPTPESARWFAEGPSWTVGSADGEPTVVTSQVSARGTEPLEALGLSAAAAAREEMGRHRETLLWTAVTAVLFPNGNHLSMPEVYVASEEGVTQSVGYAGVLLPAVYEPAMTVLPADPAVGDEWSQRGTASWRSNELASYRLDAEVTAVSQRGCVDVRTRLRLTMSEMGSSIGGEDSDDTSTATYCPGRWLTAIDGDVDTKAVSLAAADEALAEFEKPVVVELEESEESPTELYPRGFGSQAGADALVLPDAGIAVDADRASNSVSGYVWDASYPAPQWTVFGEGPVLANPVQAGGLVVIADTHGTLTAVDAVTGFVRWQRSLGRLPMALAADAGGQYVGVLDRTGKSWLVEATTGETLATVPLSGAPVGVAVYVDDDDPVLVVADKAAVRAYRAAGDEVDEVFEVEAEVSAGPVVDGSDVLVAATNGHLVSIAPDGTDRREYVADYGLEALSAAGGVAVGTDGESAYFISTSDLSVVAEVSDDAEVVTVDTSGNEPVFTLTALDGRVTLRAADGSEVRSVQVPLAAEPPPGYGAGPVAGTPQRAGAVSVGGDIWVPAVAGPAYFGGAA